MEADLNLFLNEQKTSILFLMEDNLIFKFNGRHLNLSVNGRRPQHFFNGR
jgi:hypothetical protein